MSFHRRLSNILLFIVLFTPIFISNGFLHANSIAQIIRDLDPMIVNGKKYNFFANNVEGHQFLNTSEFTKGTLLISNRLYEDLLLNYDIYNQQLILLYQHDKENISNNRETRLLIVSDAWISNFSIGSKNFIYKSMPSGQKHIYQIHGDQNFIHILYRWKKTMRINTSEGNYIFSVPNKTSFVSIDGILYRFRNNRSFSNAFYGEKRKKIRKYFKENRIRVNKTTDSELVSLLEICNSIQ